MTWGLVGVLLTCLIALVTYVAVDYSMAEYAAGYTPTPYDRWIEAEEIYGEDSPEAREAFFAWNLSALEASRQQVRA